MKNIIKKENFEKETSEVLQDTINQIIEGLTGIASSKKEEIILSVGHIFQQMRSGQFLSTLLKEWNEFRDKGKINNDYQNTEQHYSCLSEILDFLDKEIPDKQRFDNLKKILLVASTENISDRNSVLPYYYMKIVRNLSSGAILILFSNYTKYLQNDWVDNGNVSALKWLSDIQQISGLEHKELIEIYEEELIKYKIISHRKYPDDSGVDLKPNYRFSSLGLEICKFISAYDEIKKAV